MCENDLMWSDVFNRATSVKDIMTLGENEGKKRLDCLFKFIDAKLTLLQDSKEINEARNALRNVEFLRILSRNKFSPLPWAGDSCTQKSLFKACDLFPSDAQHLVSTTMHIADDIKMPSRVKTFLGLHEKTIPPELVLKQLEHTQSVDPQALKPEQYCYFLEVVTAIYSFFEDDLNKHQTIPEAFTDMATRPCLLINKHFVLPANVAFRFHGPSCNQYLQAAPESYRVKYQRFLQALGVKESFDVQDYVNVLDSIHKKAKGNTLRKNQLKVCLSVLTLLNDTMEKQQLSVEDVRKQFGVIYVPNKKAILRSSTSLCYDDCPWIQRDNLDYAHDNISYEVSCRLGIKTKKERTVQKYAKGIPFGQKEKLTNSIQRILKTCPRDHQIFKELIQNADDAGATEIHFIRDGRTHGKQKIFHESWEQLQGPALCVYNNRPFTTADLEGIQNLGEGSKGDDPCKTGQYGIGFSSVYHLTDVPSILTSTDETGPTLCVFDPNCQYVQDATPTVPGMRYNMEELAAFTDVTSCYHKDQFDLENGSMFRLPLRTEEMANKSHLSVYGAISMANISDILESLKNELFDILLFTNNLEEIKISDINQSTGKLEKTYVVRICNTEELQMGRHAVLKAVETCGKVLRSGQSLQTVPRHEFLYQLTIKDNNNMKQQWCISQIIGVHENTEIPSGVAEAFGRGDLVLLPRGGCAMRLDEAYVQHNKKAFCFLPLPDPTGLPLHVNGHFALGHENRGHIWGPANTGGYKEQWNYLLCSAVIADCYVNLVAQYKTEVETLLKNKTLKLPSDLLDNYKQLFPTHNYATQPWHKLVQSVYKGIERRGLKLFPVLHLKEFKKQKGVQHEIQWVSVSNEEAKKAYFSQTEHILDLKPQYGVQTDKHTNDKPMRSQLLKNALLSMGMNLVWQSDELGIDLEKSDVIVNFVTPQSVTEFIRAPNVQHRMCNLKNHMPCLLKETIFKTKEVYYVFLKFCLQDDRFKDNLDGVPLLLTENNNLQMFSVENPIFSPTYCKNILLNRTDRFIDHVLFEKLAFPDNMTCDVIVEPTIDDMAKLLPCELDASYCSGRIVKLHKDTLFLHSLWEFFVSCTMPRKIIKDTNSTQNETGRQELSNTAVVLVTDDSDTDVKNENHEDELNYLKALEPLGEFSLIPCVLHDGNYLYPFSRAQDIIWVDPGMPLLMTYILKKMNIPVIKTNSLHWSMMTMSDIPVVELGTSIVTSSMNRLDMLELIHRNYTEHTSEQAENKLRNFNWNLSDAEANCLVKYFMSDLSEMDGAGKLHLLKDLPIHVTVSGHMVSLTEMDAVYCVPANIPTEGMDYWQDTQSMAFLKEEPEFKQLYELLGCKNLSAVNIYCDCILKHFELFSEHDALTHMYFLYNKYLTDKSEDAFDVERLTESMTNVPLFKDNNDLPQCANEFSDPLCELFLEMLPDDEFPPMLYLEGDVPLMTRWTMDKWLSFINSSDVHDVECRKGWSNKDWLKFLRKIGLVEHPTPARLLNFARQVEKEADTQALKEIERKAKQIINELYKTKEADQCSTCSDIRIITFIPQQEVTHELHELHPQAGARHGNKVSLIPFQGSIGREHEQLIWTSMVLVPDWALPSKQFMPDKNERVWIQQLGLSQEPSVKNVLQHVKNVIHSIQTNIDVSDTIMETKTHVLKSIYRYYSNPKKVNLFTIQELHQEPIVLVNGKRPLVRACQTAVNLPPAKEIKPYLYKIPNHVGEFVPLFEKLGATDSPTIQQYASVLEYIKTECGENEPQPDQLDEIFRAIEEIFNSGEDLDKLNSLYMPNEHGLLRKTKTLVFNDVPDFRQRLGEVAQEIPLMADLLDANVGGNKAYDVLASLPDAIQPQMLSSLVHEELCENTSHNVGPGLSATDLEERVRSDEFMDAAKRLILHESWRGGDNISNQAVMDLVTRLANVRVRCRDGLRTLLFLGDQAIQGSEKDKLCFLRKPGSEGTNWTLYVCNDVTKKSQIMIMFSNSLNNIVDDRMRSCVAFLPSLVSCPVEDIDDLLTAYNISKVHIAASKPVSHVALRPRIGGLVPEHKHTQLTTGGTIEEGCLVVYQVGEAKMYVRVLKIDGYSVTIDLGRNKQTVNYLTLMTFKN